MTRYFDELNKIDPKLSPSSHQPGTEANETTPMIICVSLKDLSFLVSLVIENAGIIESESPKCVTYAKK